MNEFCLKFRTGNPHQRIRKGFAAAIRTIEGPVAVIFLRQRNQRQQLKPPGDLQIPGSRCLALLLLGAAFLPACSTKVTNEQDSAPPAVQTPGSTVSSLPEKSPDSQQPEHPENRKSPRSVRFATFNIALNRGKAGELVKELSDRKSKQAAKLAEVIQRVRPDVILLNEIDYDSNGESVELFHVNYLAVGRNGHAPIEFPYRYTAPVNTGVDSGLDLDSDGATGTAADAWGFGQFPGQYGMAVLSRFPIDLGEVRTFRNFAWSQMPDAKLPKSPQSGNSWYPDAIWEQLRLSSKSHWDIPIHIEGRTVHFLCAHPTPPVFDGPEDRNGNRNHDEIRLWADYIGGDADYLVDDNGVRGGLDKSELFVVAGDMNADPLDGDSAEGAAAQLTQHARIARQGERIPASAGGPAASEAGQGVNREHIGDSAWDTADFNDANTGNLRIDYCLPCNTLPVTSSGVFWPPPDGEGNELNDASDHHLVWVDVELVESPK